MTRITNNTFINIGQVSEFNPKQMTGTCVLSTSSFFVKQIALGNSKKRASLLISCGTVMYKLVKGLTTPSRPAKKSFNPLTPGVH